MDIDEFLKEVIELLSLPPKKPPTHIQTSEFVGWWLPEIKQGEKIKQGKKGGTIEVLGVKNEILSEKSGKIIKIDSFPNPEYPRGYPVEYGEPIFEIEIAS